VSSGSTPLRTIATRRLESEEPFAPLREAGELVFLEPGESLADRLRREPCDAVLCTLADRVDAAALDAGSPRLRVVSSVSVGLDHVDLEAADRLGIAVCNTPGVLTEATADLAFALLLAAARRIPEADRYVREGRWQGWSPDLMLGHELHGATLGIVGFGRIGQAMARRGRGFGMEILYHQRNRAATEVEQALDAEYASLGDVCERADFLSLHVPGTPETAGLIDADHLARMKRGSILVNTARGSVVDEEALILALRSGHLAAAGLDVFKDEPHVDPRLVAMPQVALAPHIGSATFTTRRKMADLAVRQLLEAVAAKG
jgi:glyoxylate reductase